MAKKLFIFAIGGTGERVLRSTAMLMAAGVPAFNDYDVYPIIIDYDADNADKKRTRDILSLYNEINHLSYQNHPISGLPQGDKNEGQFFGCNIKELSGLDKFVLDFDPGNSNLKFRDKIEYDLLTGDKLKTKYLLESLYDTSDDPSTELNLDLTVGFKGNPNIGSVIFHKLGDMAEYQRFVTLYQRNQGDKIVVIGSLFGGTGASGIPVLIQQIDNDHPGADISALMIEPYFAPEITPGGAINAHLFYSKTKAALNFYKSSGLIQKLSSVYHIGDPYPTVMPYSEGGDDQKNNANPVEFIAAMAIAHFCKSNNQNQGVEYMYGISKDIVSTSDSNGKVSSCRIFYDDFDDTAKTDIIKYLDAFTFAIKYTKDEIMNGKVKPDTAYFKTLGIDKLNLKSGSQGANRFQDVIINIGRFYEMYKDWLNEMDFGGDDDKHIQPNSHRFALYDMNKDYSEMAEQQQKEQMEAKKADFWEIFGRNKTSSGRYSEVDAGYITAGMNNMLKERSHSTEKGLLTQDCEYAFMDTLRANCMDIVNKK